MREVLRNVPEFYRRRLLAVFGRHAGRGGIQRRSADREGCLFPAEQLVLCVAVGVHSATMYIFEDNGTALGRW